MGICVWLKRRCRANSLYSGRFDQNSIKISGGLLFAASILVEIISAGSTAVVDQRDCSADGRERECSIHIELLRVGRRKNRDNRRERDRQFARAFTEREQPALRPITGSGTTNIPRLAAEATEKIAINGTSLSLILPVAIVIFPVQRVVVSRCGRGAVNRPGLSQWHEPPGSPVYYGKREVGFCR